MTAGAVPIRESVGAALRFVREHVGFVAIVAAAAAFGQGVFALLGVDLAWIVAVLIAVLGAHTALTSTALGLPRPLMPRLVGDSARVGGAMAMIGVLLAMLFLLVTFVAMGVLVAPYQAELQAAGKNAAAAETILNRALAENPNVMNGASSLSALLFFAVTTRFYVTVPATIDRQRITLFESWRMTRGNFLRIAGARLMLLVPAFIFVYALQTLIAKAVGAPSSDPFALLTYSQSNLMGFALFYSASIFIQILVVSALEAGLSASLYRALKAADAPKPSQPPAA